MITFEGVSVALPEPIISDANLTLSEHRIALIGANGSGKSTLARLINGLVLPTTGTVTIETPEGTLDTRTHGKQVRAHVGFVFTDPQAQLVMPTALEDVSLSLRNVIRNKKDRENEALQVLERFGLGDRKDQSVHSLSGGQAQLLALASVLATNPQVLVADEPTTLLDLRNSRMIKDLLLSLPQQLIIATHDLDFVRSFDRVLWITDGHVAYDGSPEAAITKYMESI